MIDAAARLAFVVRGVVQQAMTDAGASGLRLVDTPSEDSSLIEKWCGIHFEDSDAGLAVGSASKTELLLGQPMPAALYPLGDLYASEVAALGGSGGLSREASQLAQRAGGVARLDDALRALLDERRDADAAFVHIPELQESVRRRLQQTRFRRAHPGIVPKLGARTIGIDLFI